MKLSTHPKAVEARKHVLGYFLAAIIIANAGLLIHGIIRHPEWVPLIIGGLVVVMVSFVALLVVVKLVVHIVCAIYEGFFMKYDEVEMYSAPDEIRESTK